MVARISLFIFPCREQIILAVLCYSSQHGIMEVLARRLVKHQEKKNQAGQEIRSRLFFFVGGGVRLTFVWQPQLS